MHGRLCASIEVTFNLRHAETRACSTSMSTAIRPQGQGKIAMEGLPLLILKGGALLRDLCSWSCEHIYALSYIPRGVYMVRMTALQSTSVYATAARCESVRIRRLNKGGLLQIFHGILCEPPLLGRHILHGLDLGAGDPPDIAAAKGERAVK